MKPSDRINQIFREMLRRVHCEECYKPSRADAIAQYLDEVSELTDAASSRDVDKETGNENANTGKTRRKQRAG